MRVLFVFLMLFAVLFHGVADAATVNAHIMGVCTDSRFQYFCSQSQDDCWSISETIEPPQSYPYCGAYNILGESQQWVVCFSTHTTCDDMFLCPTGRYGPNPSLAIASLVPGVTSFVTNPDIRNCCETATCPPRGIFADISGQNYQSQPTHTCSPQATCITGRPYRRCKGGYYNDYNGQVEFLDTAIGGTSNLPNVCKSCATETGKSISTSTLGDNGPISKCFVPPLQNIIESGNTYHYTSTCFYTP